MRVARAVSINGMTFIIRKRASYETFLFSEEHEHYTVDDYISKGDIGPWYYVVFKTRL